MPPPVERRVVVENTLGLHFRPATKLVKLASQFQSDVLLVRDEKVLNAKSIMEVLLLAADKGTAVTLRAEGPDAEEAVERIAALFARRFDEE